MRKTPAQDGGELVYPLPVSVELPAKMKSPFETKERLYFWRVVEKLTRTGKPQQRVLVVLAHMLQLAELNGTVHRAVKIRDLEKVFLHFEDPPVVVIKVKPAASEPSLVLRMVASPLHEEVICAPSRPWFAGADAPIDILRQLYKTCTGARLPVGYIARKVNPHSFPDRYGPFVKSERYMSVKKKRTEWGPLQQSVRFSEQVDLLPHTADAESKASEKPVSAPERPLHEPQAVTAVDLLPHVAEAIAHDSEAGGPLFDASEDEAGECDAQDTASPDPGPDAFAMPALQPCSAMLAGRAMPTGSFFLRSLTFTSVDDEAAFAAAAVAAATVALSVAAATAPTVLSVHRGEGALGVLLGVGLPGVDGIALLKVAPGSPAERAGCGKFAANPPTHVITSANGVRIESEEDLAEAIAGGGTADLALEPVLGDRLGAEVAVEQAPTQQAGQAEPTLQAGQAEPTLQAGQAEPTQQAGQAEPTERSLPAEQTPQAVQVAAEEAAPRGIADGGGAVNPAVLAAVAGLLRSQSHTEAMLQRLVADMAMRVARSPHGQAAVPAGRVQPAPATPRPALVVAASPPTPRPVAAASPPTPRPVAAASPPTPRPVAAASPPTPLLRSRHRRVRHLFRPRRRRPRVPLRRRHHRRVSTRRRRRRPRVRCLSPVLRLHRPRVRRHGRRPGGKRYIL
eukprot:TRINITY_DN9129_c0_g2_i1.p1 TRINITY_DN9129_c0_g2~~TRINITY_DN9129_c0_g2_i1.p1  ORF type:complete len:681 (+),score=216.39 TRINITY_DN9129_c0_g2_i1:133-2175(+)